MATQIKKASRTELDRYYLTPLLPCLLAAIDSATPFATASATPDRGSIELGLHGAAKLEADPKLNFEWADVVTIDYDSPKQLLALGTAASVDRSGDQFAIEIGE